MFVCVHLCVCVHTHIHISVPQTTIQENDKRQLMNHFHQLKSSFQQCNFTNLFQLKITMKLKDILIPNYICKKCFIQYK